MFEKFYDKYETEEHEVIARVGPIIRATNDRYDMYWFMTAWIKGAVFCNSGKLIRCDMQLNWPILEQDMPTAVGFMRFSHEDICRLKVRKMKMSFQAEIPIQQWCIVQVLNDHEECPNPLKERFDDCIYDEILGKLRLDREDNAFYGAVTWCGKKIGLKLDVDAYSDDSWYKAIEVAKTMLSQCVSWDRKLREAAGRIYAERVNDNIKLSNLLDFDFSAALSEALCELECEPEKANKNQKKKAEPELVTADEKEEITVKAEPELVTADEMVLELVIRGLAVDAYGYFDVHFDKYEYLGEDLGLYVTGSLNQGIRSAYFMDELQGF